MNGRVLGHQPERGSGRLSDNLDQARRWDDVRHVFVEKSQIRFPDSVQIPVGDEVETPLQYPKATFDQVPALEWISAYIDLQKKGAGWESRTDS